MHRYSQEEKRMALERAHEIGVTATAKEMNIAIQSLYKWRNDFKTTYTKPATSEQPQTDCYSLAQMAKEIEQLKETTAKLKKLLAAVIVDM